MFLHSSMHDTVLHCVSSCAAWVPQFTLNIAYIAYIAYIIHNLPQNIALFVGEKQYVLAADWIIVWAFQAHIVILLAASTSVFRKYAQFVKNSLRKCLSVTTLPH